MKCCVVLCCVWERTKQTGHDHVITHIIETDATVLSVTQKKKNHANIDISSIIWLRYKAVNMSCSIDNAKRIWTWISVLNRKAQITLLIAHFIFIFARLSVIHMGVGQLDLRSHKFIQAVGFQVEYPYVSTIILESINIHEIIYCP